MSIDPRLIRSERHHAIGHLIQRDAEIMIERWCRRAVEEQPNAARVHREVLRDQFSALLAALGGSLASSDDAETEQHRLPALEHGEQRWENGWSLPEVIRDYQILRLVIVEYLEETLDRPLRSREVMAVGLALDEAITASVGMYIGNREEYVRQVERQRLEGEDRAEATRQKWEQIFQHTGWGVAITAPADDTLQAVNPAFAHMHGYAVEEVIGKPLAEMFDPAHRSEMGVHTQIANERGHYAYESLHVRKDGSHFPVLADIVAIKDEDGTLLYRAGNYQDITDRRRLEETLRATARALQESDRRKDEFLAILGHELRNSLSPLMNSVEVLRLLGSKESAVSQVKDVVDRQVKQMVRLVDDLLDLARISRGEVEVRKERYALATIMAQAVETSRPLIEGRQHRLSVSLPQAPVWVEVDRTRLVQVIANLLNNAAKYTEPGGQIWLSAERKGQDAILRVRDTGVGIAPEMLNRVFDLFMQVQQSAERSQGGLGIGLALVRRLVEIHGGTVAAHSEGPGHGSEFVVTLPVSEEMCQVGGATPVNHAPVKVSRHVLIVEDNPDGRETLQTLLKLLNHRVDVAEDGREGVAKALALRPQVALIDIGLPTLDGYQVARQVRAALGNSVFLIALTGYGQAEDRRRTAEAGFDAHLVKPVDTEQLSQLLTTCSPGLPSNC
jgi:PAS domain S-box-containing protein